MKLTILFGIWAHIQRLALIIVFKYTPTHINNSLFLSKFQYKIRFLEEFNYEK